MIPALQSQFTSTSVPILIDQQNFEQTTAALPFLVRKAFGYAIKLKNGELIAQLPNGEAYLFKGENPGPSAKIIIHDLGFGKRLFEGGDIGFAEAYIAGEWDTPDLTTFLYLFCVNHEAVATLLPGHKMAKFMQRFRHWLNRNTKQGSRRNIQAHYDLGNTFYKHWLDRTMTYSSALYAPGDNDLAAAQTRKYRTLAESGQFKSGDHILEIGCGWGGFAEFAAKEIGCKVTGLTISKEQFNYAQERIFNAGLNDSVTVKLQDYRDERGLYDRIASIEMFEAVGEQYWPTYFSQLRDRLRVGGTAAVQIITIQERFFENYRVEMDFIRRYVFPGGMLPTPTILQSMGEKHGLSQVSQQIFGRDYARTLADWRVNFRKSWPQLTSLGFDERFRRIWEYYFAYCEAGFNAENIDVRQIIYAKNA